ncbi:hypothetical protein [Bacillus thermotolerans]|uniref:Uncharacterized protein n=1 Tax=Bacillus thermotolerans TaxID=1221996 RepID=A0A0F5I321_BACTR|nr:hypothetical protein [Bacillus thermotolerans]KKB39660.1 hypothetical protein QY95_02290 [Bacillus thermotolerans]
MGLFLFASEDSFERALNQLRRTPVFTKSLFQQAVFEEAANLLEERDGLQKLYQYAHLFDEAGVFIGKPWENVRKLNPVLVRGTLHAGGAMAAAEAMSNLRMLAIAKGEYIHPEITANEAVEFLAKILALNLDLLLMKETEENRVKQLYKDKQASEILGFISEHCFSPLVFQSLYQEVNNLAVQRPIVTDKILKLIASAKRLADGREEPSSLMHYEQAVYSPSDMSAAGDQYVTMLKASDDLLLIREAEQLRTSMEETGLVSSFHPVFLNYINEEKPNLLPHLLAADETAKEHLHLHLSLISSLISSINIQTGRSIYGLMRLLQRKIFTDEFVKEMQRLVNISLHRKVKNSLKRVYERSEPEVLRSHVISGMISVLGQPLGIGQGFNPTCQSTRALSYWSQTEPVLLLKMYNHFLENNEIILDFEGKALSSAALPHVPLDDKANIDTVSLLLVPHLNSVYLEMLRLANKREQDPHKWVNPAFQIKGIWTGFSDIYNDPIFAARFYRHYHPSHNPKVNEGLPQPAGITIYNQSGQILGAHAVLIQRVDHDSEGLTRVYFYNPNNDSLQIWGGSIKTSVAGNGEQEGEASLLFEDFLKFLYAFHYPADE